LLTQNKLVKQVYVLPKLRPSPQTCYSHHHHLVNRYEIAISQMTPNVLLPTYILLFPLSPTRLLSDCVVVLYIFVRCLVPNVINVSCVHTRFYVVVFVLYILSYYYIYVLSPCYGVLYDFRKQNYVMFVVISDI
jgi:hypothetical protein